MKSTKRNKDFPLEIEISFKKLFKMYEENMESGSELLRSRATSILDYAKKYPALREGITDIKELENYQDQIDFILEDLFASVLQKNEIKVATIPFQDSIFQSTQRYKNIVKVAGSSYELELIDFDENIYYIMGCSIILNAYYGYKIDFRRPMYYDIPDAQGIMRHYKVMYNGDFMDV
ncbi:MAG: hypothetical protein HKN48_06215 [Flavobacteriaceae bacterium]|nr:hypothetical protein [Flavobacteriaceae bacterium]